jgi:hypothetical protein
VDEVGLSILKALGEMEMVHTEMDQTYTFLLMAMKAEALSILQKSADRKRLAC